MQMVPKTYPIVVRNAGSIWASRLVDLTGAPLIGHQSGRPLNLFSEELDQDIEHGYIKLIKYENSFCLFAHNDYDIRLFNQERMVGSVNPFTQYTVYFDEGFNPNLREGWVYYHDSNQQ